MAKFINFSRMLQYLFDDEYMIQKAIPVLKGLLEAQSPRLSLTAERCQVYQLPTLKRSSDFWHRLI